MDPQHKHLRSGGASSIDIAGTKEIFQKKPKTFIIII
jgi:hypothetical protein